MEWCSAMSELDNTAEAIADVVGQVRDALSGAPDLLLLFASPAHMSDYDDLSATLLEALPCNTLIGCSGGGIVGGGIEVEHQPAISLTAARLPDVELNVFRLEDDLPDDPDGWRERLDIAADAEPIFVLLPDPFSFSTEKCIAGLDAAYPKAPTVGGLASGSGTPGGNALFAGDTAYGTGAVLLSLHGNIVLDPIIAQGCRPVGEPMLVSSCEGPVIFALDNKPPGEALRTVHAQLDDDAQDLMRNALFLGIEMKDQVEYRAGDFLIRNIVGLNPDGNAMAVAAKLRQWQAVQFHLRDAAASTADLGNQLDRYIDDKPKTSAAGAVLFSCLGRGEHLYGETGHDSALFREKIGDIALGGFFCNGEIGPVGGRTFVHGYTSAFGVFRPKRISAISDPP
jgi:small ligand-binding sensory domain FIST